MSAMTRPEAIAAAQRMWADGGGGWTIAEIRGYLAERGHPVLWETVRGWADPKWLERRRRSHAAAQRRWWREHHGTQSFRVLDEHAREALLAPDLLLALRVEDGLSFKAIAAVVRRFSGGDVTESQIRHRLHALGAPKNPNKARGRRRAVA